MLSLWFTFSHGIRLAGRETSLSLGLNGFHMLAIFGYLFLIAALSSAIMMSIAAFARSFKEGQNYVTPAYLLCLVPTMMATLPGSKPSLLNSFIPIVNIAFSIKGTLEGTIHASYVLNTIISMGIFITGTLMFASKLFAHEQVLFREGDVSILGMFSVKEGLKRQTPTMTEAWTLLSIAFLLLFYVGTTAQKASPAWGLAITLWGCILLPSLLMAKMRKLNMKETFRFKAFSAWMIPGIILLMLGAAPLVSALSEFIASTTMPGWKQFLQEAQKSFSIKNFGISLPLFYILIAVSPGICEEILFRGFLQTTFEKYMKPWTAILLAAFLFGAFHLSIYRLIPTTILGVIMGWLCYRSGSIFPAMLAHMLNNAFSITLSTLVERKIITQAQLEQMPWWFLVLAGISMITGMFIILQTSTPQKDQKAPLQTPQ